MVMILGSLAGVPVRQAEAAAEKSFLLHRVRLALAHHCAAGDGFSALLGAIKRGAKAAGKSHTFLFLTPWSRIFNSRNY